MSIQSKTVKIFKSGTHNLLDDEQIPSDASSGSLNWRTVDGRVELIRGRKTLGSVGVIGATYAQHIASKIDGTAVHFKKVGTSIQYLNGTTWTDVITGLTETADYTCANYQSLAGSFVFFFGVDGIYKVPVANPTSYISLYNASINFKGQGLIQNGRTLLWSITNDKTAFRGSWVDIQTGVSGSTGVYTSVSGEATTSLSGTLAFKGGGATRNCFNVVIVVGGETFTDNYNGLLVGSVGGTGTINYATGAYTVSTAGVGTASYQWEDSNARGVTDFRYTTPVRLAGEGFMLREDYNGTPIKVIIPLDGYYFSFKSDSCYAVNLTGADQTTPVVTNEIFRTNIGVPTLRSAIATSKGIVFMNTLNETKPRLELLKKNIQGDNFTTEILVEQFKFENYVYDDCALETWDNYVMIACKENSDVNNRLILVDLVANTVDVTYYGGRCFSKLQGHIYIGDSITTSTYEIFSGFDDLGLTITNYWTSNGEKYGVEELKKVKRFRFRGSIDPSQKIGVYLGYDNSEGTLIGTILGTGDYVDYSDSETIGVSMLGEATVGGDDTVGVYNFMLEIKIHSVKFRKRVLTFKALSYGYCSIKEITDFDIWLFKNELPKKYRLKQNVSLDGETTDEDNPEY